MRSRMVRRLVVAVATAFSLAAVPALAGCATPPAEVGISADDDAAHITEPVEPVVVLDSTDPAELALTASQTFFSSAPVVVLAAADDPQAQATAAAAAIATTSPVLLVGGGISDEGLRSELRRLEASTVIEVFDTDRWDATTPSTSSAPPPADSTDTELLSMDDVEHLHLDVDALVPGSEELDPRDLEKLDDALPDPTPPQTLTEVLALTEGTPEQTAAVATARAAGAWPLVLPGGDPRATSEIVEAIASAKALAVVGIGASFGSAEDLGWKVHSAETGVELPGGGQLVFNGKRYVAVAGDAVTPKAAPAAPEDVAELLARAKTAAASYSGAVPGVVVPAVEVPVTTASDSAGKDEDYSNEIPAEAVRPFVDAASAAGVYVVLRFEPGRSTFPDQLAEYADLVALPDVGVALDVSTRRTTTSRVGGIIAVQELDQAIAQLSATVRAEALPQKLVVVRLSSVESVTGREALAPGSGEVAVAMTQAASGGLATRTAVWKGLHAGAPGGVHWGWTTGKEDPAKELTDVGALDPVPDYVVGSR